MVWNHHFMLLWNVLSCQKCLTWLISTFTILKHILLLLVASSSSVYHNWREELHMWTRTWRSQGSNHLRKRILIGDGEYSYSVMTKWIILANKCLVRCQIQQLKWRRVSYVHHGIFEILMDVHVDALWPFLNVIQYSFLYNRRSSERLQIPAMIICIKDTLKSVFTASCC